MRLITPTLHRILDFITVALFAVAPALLRLTGVAALLSYVLALVHLILTVLTQFPAGPARVVPFAWHRVIELLVGLALGLLSLFAQWGGAEQTFYLVAGIVVLAVSALTTPGAGARPPEPASPPEAGRRRAS